MSELRITLQSEDEVESLIFDGQAVGDLIGETLSGPQVVATMKGLLYAMIRRTANEKLNESAVSQYIGDHISEAS